MGGDDKIIHPTLNKHETENRKEINANYEKQTKEFIISENIYLDKASHRTSSPEEHLTRLPAIKNKNSHENSKDNRKSHKHLQLPAVSPDKLTPQ